MSTFVSVGNAIQPFSRLIDGVIAIADQLPQPVVIQYGHTTLLGSDGINAFAFMNMDEFIAQVTSAELLIMHAGAGSLIHAIQAGKVPVVMPRLSDLGEHVDNHQVEFTSALAGNRSIVVAHSVAELLDAAEEAQKLQGVFTLKPKQQPKIMNMVGDLLKSLAREYD